jgi:hypothetical protein
MTTTPQPIDRQAAEPVVEWLNNDTPCPEGAIWRLVESYSALLEWADEARTFLACAMSGTQPPRGMYVDDLLVRLPAKETR